MPPWTPDNQPRTPTTAVIQVADDGTATLYLGTELVEHAEGVDRTVMMRVLADYAATLDVGIRVTTQMPDGTWERYRLDPDGTLTPLPRDLPTAAKRSWSPQAPRPQPPAVRTSTWRRAKSRSLLLAAYLRWLLHSQ